MNYKKIYSDLVKSRLNNPPEKDFERHHILPKSLFPQHKNNPNNIVKLEYKAHYLAHHLLYRYYKSIGDINKACKMGNAWFRMCKNTNGLRVTANMFIIAKKAHSESIKIYQNLPKIKELQRKSHKGQVAWNKGIPMTIKARENMKIAMNRPEVKKKLKDKALKRKIECINTGKQYNSLLEAANDLGLCDSNICCVLKGRRKNTKGYVFKYIS